MALISNRKNHTEKSALLKQLRKDAGLTQEDLGTRLGVGRDKISHIEKCHLQQMESLTADFEDQWWHVCRTLAKPDTKHNWLQFIVNKYGF